MRSNMKILKRMIILCWITLTVCFGVKLLGGNFFSIMVSNEIYQAICSYVDKHIWTQIIIGSISTTLLNTLFLLAINRKLNFTKTEWILVTISSIICACLKVLPLPFVVNIILDVYQLIILPLIIKSDCLIEHKVRYIIFGNIIVPIFQMISLCVKDVRLNAFITASYLTASIFIIDVYIMSTLYYLYSNIKNRR